MSGFFLKTYLNINHTTEGRGSWMRLVYKIKILPRENLYKYIRP